MTFLNHTKTFMLLAGMTALFGGVGYLVGGVAGMAIAFVIAIGLNIFSYWNSDSIVLKAYRARPAEEFRDQKVRHYLKDTEALAHRAGLPRPKIYVIEMDQPNAFATGRNPDNAAVVATTGLLNMLDRDEIAGVMAHELAHVKNRDTLTMTVTATIAGAIGLLANFALFFGGGRERGGLIVGLLIAFLAPIAASIVQMAISRAREYEADRVGAEIMGHPEPLARALAKISGKAELLPDEATERNPSMAHMFIVNPLAGRRGDSLFSTHPATQNRIEALMSLPTGGRARIPRTRGTPSASPSGPSPGGGKEETPPASDPSPWADALKKKRRNKGIGPWN